MAALTSALAVKPTAGAFQTALDRRTCGGETSRGVLCVARASARARGALAGVSRPGRVVFSEERSRSAWGLGIRASARPRDVVSSDVDAWRGEAQRCSAAAAASEGDASGEVRTPRAHRDATPSRSLPPPIHPIHEILALAVFRDVPPATCRRGEGLARFFFFSAVARVASARLASCPRFVSSSRRPRDRVGTDLAPSSSSSPRTAHPARRAPRRRARRSRRW